ncbi:MAG TPA: BMC domain-containing protein [Verrucomicrobiota bacterium]|nr:BMC domain-containing protein [Verrucomicrobiota bacterium]HRR64573.1 BMC domain-containing protein [Candidatus Paceibacterota bacterium]NLH85061.1 BMC domain-containing protein [Verrucomicrobiota bacterium]HOF70617.1 BMC domain-containing protein [Verrucomicrobiota bacterium]HOM45268.1 BMC domain-containing protein [Verrucomicrobiota bacterium]
MKKHPALALIEFSSLADGLYCTDAVLKKAPIAMLKSGTVSRGRYLVILGGSTAAVEESLHAALAAAPASLLDHAFLPDAHDQVHDALLGLRQPVIPDALAMLETDTVAANVRAAEQALKGARVRLTELRLAEYEMSGKALSLFNGALHEIEAAMELAGAFLRGRKEYIRHRIVARPHEALLRQLDRGTRFAEAQPLALEGEEVS